VGREHRHHVGKLASVIMSRRTHLETGYRACLGVIRLAERFGRDRTDAACARALSIGSPNFKSVQAILKNGLDRTPLSSSPARATIDHDNIRGCFVFRQGGDR
jgi:transposase